MPVLSLSGPNAAGSAAYRFSVPGQLAQLARDSWLGATAGAADRLPYLGVVLRDQWALAGAVQGYGHGDEALRAAYAEFRRTFEKRGDHGILEQAS
jgi:hypothetical protein